MQACYLQDDIIKQRAVDNGASEIRRIMQGGTSRFHAGPANHAPPPDRLTGFVSAGGAPLQAPPQQVMPVTPAPWQQSPQQLPDLTQSVSLYVAVEAPADFNLIFKLRGPGELLLTAPTHHIGILVDILKQIAVLSELGNICNQTRLCCQNSTQTAFFLPPGRMNILVCSWLQGTAICSTSQAPQVLV